MREKPAFKLKPMHVTRRQRNRESENAAWLLVSPLNPHGGWWFMPIKIKEDALASCIMQGRVGSGSVAFRLGLRNHSCHEHLHLHLPLPLPTVCVRLGELTPRLGSRRRCRHRRCCSWFCCCYCCCCSQLGWGPCQVLHHCSYRQNQPSLRILYTVLATDHHTHNGQSRVVSHNVLNYQQLSIAYY